MYLGGRQPAEYTARASGTVSAPPEEVWRLITDVEAQPAWRSGLQGVEVLASEDGRPCWREIRGGMSVPLCVEASDRPRRLETRIADPKLPFGGVWICLLEQAGPSATRVTIEEHGRTGPEMWRFYRHYVTGEDRAAESYLSDLEAAAARGSGGSGLGGR